MNNELTDWFPADTVPFHVGIYLCECKNLRGMYIYWNGKNWTQPFFMGYIENDVINSIAWPNNPISWRGLKHNPKVSK